MGKRRKLSNSGDLKTDKSLKNKKIKLRDNAVSEETPECDPVQLSTSKIKNTELKKVLVDTKCDPVEINIPPRTLKKKKINKTYGKVDDVEKSEEFNVDDEVTESNSESLLSPAKKSKKNKVNSKTQNKKIIFTDDEPVETHTQTNKQKKAKNTELTQEEDVKDEDIDKFCEEITEEDNVQYENWVQLIEAKLNSNKKKPK